MPNRGKIYNGITEPKELGRLSDKLKYTQSVHHKSKSNNHNIVFLKLAIVLIVFFYQLYVVVIKGTAVDKFAISTEGVLSVIMMVATAFFDALKFLR